MSDQIEPVRHKGVVVNITKCQTTKKGVVYKGYQVSDYSSGKRKRWTFSCPNEARKKAKEIAEAMATGNHSILKLSPFEGEIQATFETLPVGIRLIKAAEIIRACCQVVDPDEILDACRFWKENRPDKKFTKKTLGEAVDDYLRRQGHLSERRQRCLASYFSALTDKYGDRWLHELTAADLKDFIFGKKGWKTAKTRNEVRSAVGLLFQDAEERGFTPKGYDPSATLKWEKIKPGDVGIFMPHQVRQILHNLEDELALPMALWFFGGCRKENLKRIQMSSLREALKTGFLKISAAEDLKTGARSIKLEANLKVWIQWYMSRHPDATGPVLAARYGEGRKIDNLSRKVASRSDVEWVPNAPRHTCLTMWLAKGENVQTVAKWAGNSLNQIQKHYWNRDESVTAAVAQEYFSILPPDEESDAPLPKSNTVPEPKLVAPDTGRYSFVNN